MRDVGLLDALGPVVETLPAPTPHTDARPVARYYIQRDPYREIELAPGQRRVDYYAPHFLLACRGTEPQQ